MNSTPGSARAATEVAMRGLMAGQRQTIEDALDSAILSGEARAGIAKRAKELLAANPDLRELLELLHTLGVQSNYLLFQ